MNQEDTDRVTADLRSALEGASNGHAQPESRPVNEFAPGSCRPLSADASMIHARAMETAYLQAASAVSDTREALRHLFEETDHALAEQEAWLRSQGGHLASLVHDHVEHAVAVAGAYARTKHPDQERRVQ